MKTIEENETLDLLTPTRTKTIANISLEKKLRHFEKHGQNARVSSSRAALTASAPCDSHPLGF